jgi:hypothetical protein
LQSPCFVFSSVAWPSWEKSPLQSDLAGEYYQPVRQSQQPQAQHRLLQQNARAEQEEVVSAAEPTCMDYLDLEGGKALVRADNGVPAAVERRRDKRGTAAASGASASGGT